MIQIGLVGYGFNAQNTQIPALQKVDGVNLDANYKWDTGLLEAVAYCFGKKKTFPQYEIRSPLWLDFDTYGRKIKPIAGRIETGNFFSFNEMTDWLVSIYWMQSSVRQIYTNE